MNKNKKMKKKDLILKVSKNFDITKINFDDWDGYLNVLCEDRDYQKEAIKTSLIYLIGGNYNSLEHLATENYRNNGEISDYYKSLNLLLKELQFKDKLFANIDLVTGSGKSYVMYGIAQIMLSIGAVDKVLLLCPSLTIEEGLKEKFLKLSSDQNLIDALPSYSKISTPSIVDANQFINPGDLCIENIHSVYEKTNSSIKDSFENNGKKTLVLNDESHHIYTTSEGKVWNNFLKSDKYNFKYILGFTGTPYLENEYFVDVIYRYSFKQAHEDKIIKNVLYVGKGKSFKDENEKYQVIFKTHYDNKMKYSSSKIKPITMFITVDIKTSRELGLLLAKHLVKYKIDNGDSRSKDVILKECTNLILVINYDSSMEERLRLKNIDDFNSQTEFVIGVSMLNEGWDVKNIFQIVPMEEKAFNSKLLIAQVLGRGLRIPTALNHQPTVIIINHEKWSSAIEPILDEVIKLDPRIYVKPLDDKSHRNKYHFILHNLNFKKTPSREKNTKPKATFDLEFLLENGTPLITEGINKDTNLNLIDINGISQIKTFKTRRTFYTINETIDKIFKQLSHKISENKSLEIDEIVYDKHKITKDVVKRIILKSLENSNIKDGVLTDENQNIILTAFEPILSTSDKIIVYQPNFNKVESFSTLDMNSESIGVGAFRDVEKPTTLFFTDKKYDEAIDETNLFNLKEFINDLTYPEFAKKEINHFAFKTPTNYVLTHSKPELDFVKELFSESISNNLEAWIKSKNVGFYSLEYKEVNKYGEPVSKSFNPDFFIKKTIDDIIYISVVEIKSDNDVDSVNRAKYDAGKKHFNLLNEKLKDANIKYVYTFNFLSPNSYFDYFESLKNNSLINGKFNSLLDIELLKFKTTT